MSLLRQSIAVAAFNLAALPQRAAASLVIVVGLTGVVAVLISVLALSNGFRHTIDSAARPDRVIVLSRGSESGNGSSVPRAAADNIMVRDAVRRDADGKPLASAETAIPARVAKKSDGADTYISLRGIGPRGLAVHREIRLVAGRMFRPAVNEVIVGRSARQLFANLDIGDSIDLRGGRWEVVGEFTSEGNAQESGLLADADTILAAYNSKVFNTVLLELAPGSRFEELRDTLQSDPTLEVDVLHESDYVARASKHWRRILDWLAYSIGSIMAAGALCAALNTMYSAVSARRREIATLRAIGFDAVPVVVSVLVEALLLALVGAALGCLIAYVMFNGNAISTIGGAVVGTQLIYALNVTPALMLTGVATAVGLGLLGGLLPALQAARMNVVNALRA
jgi:putative ABC transport system permease protein